MAGNPILRWTIGPVHDAGFQILSHSVKLIKKVYSDFDFYILYNGLNVNQLDFISGLGVPLIKQDGKGLECEASDVAWKLYPPRLDISRHEIFVDNDLILYKPLEEIEWFLKQNNGFIVTEGEGRLYGNKRVPENIKINSGLFGIPPNFDFAQAINTICSKRCWQNRYDEQGTVATIVCYNVHKIIPFSSVAVYRGKSFGSHGLHFCGANQGDVAHWTKYRQRSIKLG
jgi:hypothetical protein